MLEDEDDHQEVVEVVGYLVEVEGLEEKMLTQTVLMMMLVEKALWWKMVLAMELQVGQRRW